MPAVWMPTFSKSAKNEYIDSTKAEMHIYMLRLDGNN